MYLFTSATCHQVFFLSVCTTFQSHSSVWSLPVTPCFCHAQHYTDFHFHVHFKAEKQNPIVTGVLCEQWDITKFTASINPLDFHLCPQFRMTSYWISNSAELLMKSEPLFILENWNMFVLLWGWAFVKPAVADQLSPPPPPHKDLMRKSNMRVPYLNFKMKMALSSSVE